ncbi:MAG TPA: DUF2179 domain-containing protein [Thermoanaerobaculia bacterium]|jgi:uncharacterized protein YebE (UPF0316 family)
MFEALSDPQGIYASLVLPLLIFAARAFDMTLSTLRILFISQGRTKLAPLIGFFEALIWLLVMSQVLRHIANPMNAVAYAAGFAMGNLVGLRLEERLAMGMRILRIILPPDADQLVADLREQGFGVTEVDGEGWKGPVKILFTLVRRKDVPRALAIVRRHHAGAFFSVEDVRQAAQVYYPRIRDGGPASIPAADAGLTPVQPS